jgi:hypothetical protein
MVYITPELETVLEKYCIERNITRKTRDGHVFASLGTGIVQYLKSQLLGVESNSGIPPSQTLSKDDVLELIKEYCTSNVPSTVPDDSLRGEVEVLGELVTELETYTKSQFEAVREELKQATNNRTANTDSIATTQAKTISEEKRLRENPKLAARVADGLSQGMKGQALGQWLADGEFFNAKGEIYDSGTLSRFKSASELLTAQSPVDAQ